MKQQINHVSHVSFVYRLENLMAAKEEFANAFGITDWDGPEDIDAFDIRMVLSVSTGIELIAPLHEENNRFADHIRDKGEGFFAVIFGVADVRAAARQAQQKGIGMVCDPDGTPAIIDAMVMADGQPPFATWNDKLRTYQEVWLSPIGGVQALLGQIEPR